MKILMATDGSEHATKALVSACQILTAPDRDVDLMCVAPEVRGQKHPHRERLRRRAARLLDHGRQTLAEQGVSARTILESGSPASVLIGSSLRYDVTVIGAESHRDGSMAGLGPVASRIAEHSNASILIGREVSGDTGVKVLVPVDGSDGSLQALEKLGALIDLSTADVTLVHVVETPWLHTDSDAELTDDEGESGELEREFTREAEEILENARTRLSARTAVETLIYRGNPADEILGEAERGAYDLVVVASSGSIDLKHQMLGSVSMKVAWNAPCSVLLVRPGGGSS